uniref:Friend leukemia integration 1b n=1 Tax=Heterorhabditis bacteriophora TaxID=37862 RepID=A0A1I7XSN0_HETBA
MTLMTMPDSGPNSSDVKYFKMNSIVQGRGPNRLKYLDLEGRWVLSGKSMSYISTAFNHLEKLNHSQVPLKASLLLRTEITDEPLNAIGMQHWTPSSEPAKTEKKTPPKLVKPSVFVENEVPPSPRENMPHRSAGYGEDLQMCTNSMQESVPPIIDWYDMLWILKEEKVTLIKIEETEYYTRSPGTGRNGAIRAINQYHRRQQVLRPPYRTPMLSPQPLSLSKNYDIEYLRTTLGCEPFDHLDFDHLYKDELRVATKNSKKTYVPYRTGGYGAYHERRQYDLSPRSTGSTGDYTSGSEQSSPASVHEKNADEILMMTYHLRKTETIPRIYKANYNKY